MHTETHQIQSPYIPSEAYLYFPKSDANVLQNSGQRTIFDGNTQFTAHEQKMINDLKSYAQKHDYTLKSLWTDNMILRFLYANGFKLSKTLSSISEHTIWREANLPVKVDSELEKILKSGLLYVQGRDHEFHPIVIFNVYQIDPKKVDVDLVTRALTYWFEHVINEWMLPGQVENWIFIADVKGMSVSTLLQPSVRKLFAYLQDNYKCRLHTLYVLNVTTTLYGPWRVVKKFLDEVTVQKIQILKSSIPAALLNSTNSSQIEQKYGGSAHNTVQYWPPVIPSNDYFINLDDLKALISEAEYISLYNNHQLTNMIVDQARVCSQTPREKDNAETCQEVISLGSSSTQDSLGVASCSEQRGDTDSDDYDDDVTDVDYLEYIDEGPVFKINVVTREFQSSFFH